MNEVTNYLVKFFITRKQARVIAEACKIAQQNEHIKDTLIRVLSTSDTNDDKQLVNSIRKGGYNIHG